LAAGRFRLEDIRCTGGAVEVDLQQRTVTITVAAGDRVLCTFVNVRRELGPGPQPPPSPPGGGGPGGGGGGLAETGMALGGLLTLGFGLMTAGRVLLVQGGGKRHRRPKGRHRPGAARAWATGAIQPPA
jgi:hypothetical protein